VLIAYAATVVLLNLLWLVLTLVNLPGNWLMVLTAAGFAWWTWDRPDGPMFALATLGAAVGLALVGELLEFLAGLAGARKAGGSKWSAALAVVGGIIGGVFGFLIPIIPPLNAILGAAIGAFAGAMTGDLIAGRRVVESLRSGEGAFVGRLLGTLGKFAVGVILFALFAVTAFL